MTSKIHPIGPTAKSVARSLMSKVKVKMPRVKSIKLKFQTPKMNKGGM